MSKAEYSAREGWKSPGFGYASDMVARAVTWDDAEGLHPDNGGHCKCKLDGKGACKELA